MKYLTSKSAVVYRMLGNTYKYMIKLKQINNYIVQQIENGAICSTNLQATTNSVRVEYVLD